MTADSPLQVDEFPLPLLDGKKVNLSVLKSVLNELANLEAIPFEELVWVGPEGKVIDIPQDVVDEWRFIGLGNSCGHCEHTSPSCVGSTGRIDNKETKMNKRSFLKALLSASALGAFAAARPISALENIVDQFSEVGVDTGNDPYLWLNYSDSEVNGVKVPLEVQSAYKQGGKLVVTAGTFYANRACEVSIETFLRQHRTKYHMRSTFQLNVTVEFKLFEIESGPREPIATTTAVTMMAAMRHLQRTWNLA